MQYLNPSGKLKTRLSRPKNMIGRCIRIITLSLLGMFATHQLLAQKHYANGENNTINGICVGCGVLNSSMAVTNTDLTDFSTILVVPGIKDGYAKQILIFPQVSQGGKDSIVIRIGTVSRYTDAAAFQKVEVTTYNGVTSNNDRLSLTSSGVNLVPTNDPWTWEIRIMPVHAFDRVELRVNSDLVSFVSAVQVYYAYYKQYVLPDANGVVYVKKGSTGNGSSWANAIGELSDALLYGEFNPAVKQIWVAGGTYYPTYSAVDGAEGTNGGKTNSFVLPDNVKIYGGFAGTETTLAQRDLGISANRSVLSGDLDNNDDPNGVILGLNATHVVIAAGGTTHLDGFSIWGGVAETLAGFKWVNGLQVPIQFGAGIMVESSTANLRNLFIQGNMANIGGGICGRNGTLIIENAVVTGNYVQDWGGGIGSIGASVTIINSTISGNIAGSYPSIFHTSAGGVIVSNAIIAQNTSIKGNTASSGVTVEYSIIDEPWMGPTNLIQVDPLFKNRPVSNVAYTGGDFNVKANSPAIDNGNNNKATFTTDITGKSRIVNGKVDIGAYERQLLSQTIDATDITKLYSDQPFLSNATASSGLELNYSSSDNSIAEAFRDAADGNKWKIRTFKVGQVKFTLTQPGGNGYEAATPKIWTVTIERKPVAFFLNSTTVFQRKYNGNNQTVVQPSDFSFVSGGIINNDEVGFQLNGVIATYDDANAGTGKTVTVSTSGITLNGAAAGNYVLSNLGQFFNLNTGVILPKELTVTVAGVTKFYGTPDPGFFYSVQGLLPGDNVTGAASRTPGEDAGTYPFTQGTLTAGPNYTLIMADKTLIITPKLAVISFNANAVIQKTYDGNTSATINAGDLTIGGIVNNDQLGIDLSNANATYSSKDAGLRSITLPSAGITLTGAKAGNYSLGNVLIVHSGNNIAILPKPLTVTAAPATKVYGSADPALTYTVSQMVAGEQLSGGPSRMAGEDAGIYPISRGSIAASSNYALTFIDNQFTITKAPQVITWSQNLSIGCNGINPVALSASSNSGMPVSYIVGNPGLATINGNILTPLKPGQTTITAVQQGDNNHEAATRVSQTFHYQSPDAIRQRWNDVLVFDNSNNDYVQWQWFKNGTSINGATQQYYNEAAGLKGDYYVIATTKNGEQLQSCPLTATGAASGGQLKVAPNPAKPGSTISVNCNYDASLLTGAKLQLTSVTGTVMQQVTNVLPLTKLDMPATGGLYIITLVLNNGQKASLNILVK
ncbi:hypothetical protein HHL16_22685 [Pseudoflavitalea sp. G-6-1-2]|uniref:MBG domain-containing protein n=1 Tax=Pseudoflavitalea sp. G-6-1-2 TaxID=2728841 RepID=UPI00146EA7E9|nr:MBG domain-containing protein [Pseudoflavitalea sp. G-6-1-2]NML23705.1 hypothetical protein [Pseudoflavitalea sp. G-6-1-2]